MSLGAIKNSAPPTRPTVAQPSFITVPVVNTVETDESPPLMVSRIPVGWFLPFAGKFWSSFIISNIIYYFSRYTYGLSYIGFSSITYTSTMLAFLTRVEFVRYSDFGATAGILQLFVLLMFWGVYLLYGRTAIYEGEANVYLDVVVHTLIPLDTFLIANFRGEYYSYYEVLTTLFMLLGYLIYFYTSPFPYPFVQEMDSTTRIVFTVVTSSSVVLFHLLYVTVSRMVFMRDSEKV